MQSREPRFWLHFHRGAREGDRVPLVDTRATLGRRADNDIVVAHSSVSGRHAEIEVVGERVTVRDAGSTNGTKVGGAKIEIKDLTHGDTVVFGTVRTRFEDDQGAPLPALAPPGSDDDDAPAAPRSATVVSGLDDDEGEVLLDDDEIRIEEDILLDEGDGDAPPKAAPVPAARVNVPKAPADDAPAFFKKPVAGEDRDEAELATVSAERVAASGSRSKLGLVLLLVVIVGGAAAWFLTQKDQGGGETVAVPDVPGNLVVDGTFEGDDVATWEAAEAAPQTFFVDRAYSLSGGAGLGVSLVDGEWAMARSNTFQLSVGRRVDLRASLAVSGAAVARVGVEMTAADESLPPTRAWAPALATDGSREVELSFDTLPGYDRGTVVVAGLASGDGDVSLDDVSVLLDSAVLGPTAKFEEYELRILGSTAVLVRSGRVLFSSMSLSSWNESGLTGWSEAAWTGSATANGFELATPGAAPKGVPCELVAAGNRALAPDENSAPVLATMGPGGYQAHALPFEYDGATDLLAGSGVNLIRFGAGDATQVSGVRSGDTTRLRMDFSGRTKLELQLQFRDERAEANRIAAEARTAERENDEGRAIALWSDLVDRFPFEQALLREAGESRARLAQVGHDRIDELRAEFERANFFQLGDLYAQCREDALAVAARFEGTPTEASARELVDEIDTAMAGHSRAAASTEVSRLEKVLEAMDAEAEPSLYKHVNERLQSYLQPSQD